MNEQLCSGLCAAWTALTVRPTPRTHSDILQVPTDLFDVNAAVKGHPATTEKSKERNVRVILG